MIPQEKLLSMWHQRSKVKIAVCPGTSLVAFALSKALSADAVSTNSSEPDDPTQQRVMAPKQQPSDHTSLLEQLVETTLALLASSRQPDAKLALQLLPAIEKFITAHQPETLGGFSAQIWNTCRCNLLLTSGLSIRDTAMLKAFIT